MRNMNVQTPDELYREARLVAKAYGLTISGYVRKVLREAIAQEGGAKK